MAMVKHVFIALKAVNVGGFIQRCTVTQLQIICNNYKHEYSVFVIA